VAARLQPSFAAVTHAQWHKELLREGVPLDELVERVERLAEDGTFTYKDLEAAAPELAPRPFRVRSLTPLVHVPPSGTWDQLRIRLTTASRWLGAAEPPFEEAAKTLVRSYLRAFGPASRADLLRFSGLRVTAVDPALEALEPELRRFEDESGRVLLDVPRAPLPEPQTPAPVRFLPKWDALLLSHDDRSRVMTAEHQRLVIDGGDVDATFLVDGFVAGRWRYERGKVELEPFDPLPRRGRRELEDEAKRLAGFLV
jgi:hypothetical protein